jgi:YHS domain-containing protein
MFRAFLYLIAFLLIMSVVRSVLGIVSKAFSGLSSSTSPQAGASGSRPPSSPPTGGELKKDPVCGTFISTATAFQKSVDGQTYYFCSTECRDKFPG